MPMFWLVIFLILEVMVVTSLILGDKSPPSLPLLLIGMLLSWGGRLVGKPFCRGCPSSLGSSLFFPTETHVPHSFLQRREKLRESFKDYLHDTRNFSKVLISSSNFQLFFFQEQCLFREEVLCVYFLVQAFHTDARGCNGWIYRQRQFSILYF